MNRLADHPLHMPLPLASSSGFRVNRLLHLLFLVLGTSGALAQEPATTVAEVLRMKDDTTKVLLLSDHCFALRRTDPDSARQVGQAALSLARQLSFKRGEAQALNDLAILEIDRSNYVGADSLLFAALHLREALNDPLGMAAVYNKLGISYQARSMFEQALEVDRKALAIYERMGPPQHEATLLNNIGILQFNLHRLGEALATHRRAVALRDSIGDGPGLAASRGNLANVHLAMGDTTAAIALYRSAIADFRHYNDPLSEAVQLHNLAGIHLAQGDLRKAEVGYTNALSLRTQADERKGMASSLIGLGATRMKQHRLAEADSLLHHGLALAHEVGARSERLQALDRLIRLHALRRDPDRTLQYLDRLNSLKDSVFNTELGLRLAESEARFHAEKKERRIQEQRAAIAELEQQSEHRRLWLFLAVGGAAMIILLGTAYFQMHRRRTRARHDARIIHEREAGLRGILEATESERKRVARELHDGVGQVLAGLKMRLEALHAKPVAAQGASLQQVIALANEAGTEVRHIAHDLMPSSLEKAGLEAALEDLLTRTFAGAGIDHQFRSTPMVQRLHPAVEVNAYRIVQELVQNTLKHAQATRVDLELHAEGARLLIRYADDGMGLPGTLSPGGIGLRNMHERARSIGGTVALSSPEGQGLQAVVTIDKGHVR